MRAHEAKLQTSRAEVRVGAGGKTYLRRKTSDLPPRRRPAAQSTAGRFHAEDSNDGANDGADTGFFGGAEPGANVSGAETGAERSGADSFILDIGDASDHSDRLRRCSRRISRAPAGHAKPESALYERQRSNDRRKPTGERSRQCGRVTITGQQIHLR